MARKREFNKTHRVHVDPVTHKRTVTVLDAVQNAYERIHAAIDRETTQLSLSDVERLVGRLRDLVAGMARPMVTCPKCGGVGKWSDAPRGGQNMPCPKCSGGGEIEYPRPEPRPSQPKRPRVSCGNCDGAGCGDCRGNGWVYDESEGL